MLETLQNIKKVRRYILFSIILFITALGLDYFFNSELYKDIQLKRFQERFIQAESELELRIDNTIGFLENQTIENLYIKKAREFRDLAEDRKIYIYIYRNDSLLLWSDNHVVENEILPFIAIDHQLLQLSNCWCYTIIKNINGFKVIGLFLIKNNYNIKNQYLENSFNPSFNLDESISIKSSTIREKYIIYNNRNTGTLSIVFPTSSKKNFINHFLILFCFVISLYFIFKGFGKYIQTSKSEHRRFMNLGIYGITLFALYITMKMLRFPNFLFNLSSFNQICLSVSWFNLTLGDLFSLSLINYFIFFFGYTELHQLLSNKISKKYDNIFIYTISIIFLVLYFYAFNQIFEVIINKASISFDLTEIYDNGSEYIIAIGTAVLLFTVFIFLSDFVFHNLLKAASAIKIISLTIFVIVLLAFIINLIFNIFEWYVPLILICSLFIIIYLRNIKKISYKYIHVIVIVVLFSFYSVLVIFQVSERKQKADKVKMIQELASEHDQIAEYLIEELGNKMSFDTTIRQMALKKNIDFPWIYKYIRKKYFAGYWDRYDLQITICNPIDSVLINPDNRFFPCFDFFENLFKSNAEQLKNSNYYFLKNSNGRISYITSVNYYSLYQKAIVFLQLDSRLNTDALGYPQLLINQDQLKSRKLRNYSYAKYYKEKIAYQSGNYLYNSSSTKYPSVINQYLIENFGGYDHLFYKPNNDNLIILSKPALKFFDFIVSFSYLFIVIFILLNVMLLTANPKQFNLNLRSGFKTRVRLSVVGMLLLSLLTVAGITIYYITEQYTSKHYETMGEKLQSVYLELENNLSSETKLSYIWKNEEYNNLENLLRHLSNLFSTDINIYAPSGRMVASSRPEIFDKGICGAYMNSMAYFQMTKNNKIEFIQNEWLGNQRYSSIYTPFVNYQGNIIAYINLPYFTKQSELTDEISTMLMAIINFYIILALVSLSLAVVISDNITRPLKVIQESIATMKIGKGNEKIKYSGKDEIADLIDEYNRKVDELERSAELLSKSEREFAWREMAKQVAHEIKNPLTPMKLSIQQLQRSWNDKHAFIENYFERVTQTLIEQIDNLSTIATEFSNFAQMPLTKNEKIDLKKLIYDTISLFNNNNTIVDFKYNVFENADYSIWADKEQLIRVFINLLNNSFQAIPENVQGKIEISMIFEENKIKVIVSDNGKGIQEENRNKLFQPNFTTKSSGSGLGLAICKKIIENAGGIINYEPGKEIGSTFIVSLPHYKG